MGLYFLGVSGVLGMVTLSGYAATYFEQILKQPGERLTIWERNFQLAFYSIIFMVLVLTFNTFNSESVQTTRTPFSGWSYVTVMVAVISAAGGLLVAACLKYADAILKTMATAAAILISTFVGHIFLGGPLDIIITLGAMCTILAIVNYTFDSTPSSLL
jgi:UDP-sugar transporter A1/2/3